MYIIGYVYHLVIYFCYICVAVAAMEVYHKRPDLCLPSYIS